MIREGDSAALRKERGAFFTPAPIAEFLAEWAVAGNAAATVLDPTCGEAVFLLSAGRRLRLAGASAEDVSRQLYGVDLHQGSLDWARDQLDSEMLGAQLLRADFFDVGTPDQLVAPIPLVDAVIGNPPFVRYQSHVGAARDKSRQAALRQRVRLSGLASSWAALLVHSCAFLKPSGRLAMVLPAELLTVGYAEPVRAWLRQRFEQVHLVLFEQLQFADATEKVVLVLASGEGGCEAFSLYTLADATELDGVRPMTNLSVVPPDRGKWTDLLLSNRQRRAFSALASDALVPLATYGKLELGTVTGANHYFTLNEDTRRRYGLVEGEHVVKVCPAGTKHLSSMSFTNEDWERQRDAGQRVWLLHADPANTSAPLRRYLDQGLEQSVDQAYKCRMRKPWWRAPLSPVPDLYFTYMSHRYPRLVTNAAATAYLNSMHGLRLHPSLPAEAALALPYGMLNSVTLLGAELGGRSYGGGILKMEPREASALPMPPVDALMAAWSLVGDQAANLDQLVVDGRWAEVVEVVDRALLQEVMRLPAAELDEIRAAVAALRARRLA